MHRKRPCAASRGPEEGPYTNWKANNQGKHKTRKWLSMLVGPRNDCISFCVLNCSIIQINFRGTKFDLIFLATSSPIEEAIASLSKSVL